MQVVFPVSQHAKGFSHVVQQRGKADLRLRVFYTPQGMFEYVVIVKVAALFHPVAEGKFGQDFSEYARFPQNAEPAVGRVCVPMFLVGVQNQRQFFKNAFGRDVADERAVLRSPRKRFFVGRKSEFRGEPCKPHEPQSVLAEDFFCRHHRAQRFSFDVAHSAERVAERSGFYVVINRVRAKIPSACVGFDAIGKGDLRRRVDSAHVLIGAEAREFVFFACGFQFHRTRVSINGFNGKAARLGGGNQFVFCSRRGNVPVRFGQRKTAEKVSYASAHHVKRERACVCEQF